MHLDGFQFGKFLNAKAPEFTPLPAFAVAAKGQLRIAAHPGIQPDRAGPDAAADRQAVFDAGAPDAGRKAVERSVGTIAGKNR